MKWKRILVFGLIGLVLAVLWLLWVTPKPVDMARFAPANSLLYLEANKPATVLDAIATTDTWKLIDSQPNGPKIRHAGGLLQQFIRATGIGPIDSVILARSQVALVVTDVNASEEGENLNVKPEAVLLLETHTAERRIRAPIERALHNLVTNAYGSRTPLRTTLDGVEFVEWKNENGARHVVATFFGSTVIIGNSQRAVHTCLNVGRGRAPSLRDDPGLDRARAGLAADNALAFGYVPESESSRLISLGLPIVLGRVPEGTEFQKLIGRAATRIFGSLAWSARPFRGGIEDRYQVSLQPPVAIRLAESIGPPNIPREPALAGHFHSMSQYKFGDPARAWQTLRTTVSGNIDALGAVVFDSILRSALSAYGVEEPEIFLTSVDQNISTIRLDENGDRQLLVAGVRDPSRLQDLFRARMGFMKRTSVRSDTTVLENRDGSVGVALSASLIVIGHPADVEQYFQRTSELVKTDRGDQRITYFSSGNGSHVTTYTDDAQRVRAFINASFRLSGADPSGNPQLEPALANFPYAVTETTLHAGGLERVTRSPMGQFGTLITLFIPENNSSQTPTP